jgi:TFIIF-interacting CTD phosphatase-like protein
MKKNLYLDLDLTLVYVETFILGYVEPDFNFKLEDRTYYVNKRPHLDDFLNFCFTNFNVSIITASTRDYATEIVKNLNITNKLQALITRENLVKEEYLVQTLSTGMRTYTSDYVKVINNGILVDDKDYIMQGENNKLIQVIPYFPHNNEDDSLLTVLEQLQKELDHDNF